MKKIASLLLVFVLMLSASPLALADGEDGDDLAWADGMSGWYTPGIFSDVPEGVWYEDALDRCYSGGLVTGDSATIFDPSGNVTIGMAVTFAARAREYLTGAGDGSVFEATDPWYLTYVKYAQENGIIAEEQFLNMEAAATRRDMAVIMASALPEVYRGYDFDVYAPVDVDAYEAVNRVDEGAIPDVPASDPGFGAIYKLYRAGILTGGENGAFRPDESISRAEAVVLLDRLVFDGYRARFMLTRGGLYSIYMGGIGFKTPAGFTVEYVYDGMADLSVYDGEGLPAAYIQIISMPYYLTADRFKENGKELFSQFLYTMGGEFEGGEEPVISDSTFAGLPAYTLTNSYSVEMGGEFGTARISTRADLTFNPNNSSLVCAIFETQDGTGDGYLPAYESMLAGAVVDETNTGGEVGQDVIEMMDRLTEFVPQYLEFLQRFSDTMKKKLPDLYEEMIDKTRELVELSMDLSGMDASTLSGAEVMYIASCLRELLSALPGGGEALEGLFGELGGIF